MSVVNITNIQVLDNPTRLANPFQFEITFECIAPLAQDLEWKIVYVGSAEDETYDQVLDCIMVGPVPVGINKFVFQADPPRLDQIPVEDLIGVTVVLITCSYNDTEFVRVGYYVNNEYDSEEWRAAPPEQVHPERILRMILHDKPRVTRFPIKWDDILDETAKKPEDEELDKDADLRSPDPNAGGGRDDAGGEGSEASEEPESEGEEDEEEEDDEFTSQLGPEEQDRMSMMIDGEEEEPDHQEMLDENMAQSNHQPVVTPLKPSPLGLHVDEDHAMLM